MHIDKFDFELSDKKIALKPTSPRDHSKLLVIDNNKKVLSDKHFYNLIDYLNEGDVLVINDTKVINAYLEGFRLRGNNKAKISLNLLKQNSTNCWQALIKPLRKVTKGDCLIFSDEKSQESSELQDNAHSLTCEVKEISNNGEIEIEFAHLPEQGNEDFEYKIAHIGKPPLPPYIIKNRNITDRDKADYQTIYAKLNGSVAAPTAGLHFTEELIKKIINKKIQILSVTLHVGAGTFLPVKVSDINNHKMHFEYGEITAEVALNINKAKNKGKKIIAVGTTSLRLIESASDDNGNVLPFKGETDIFISPGYKIKTADMLITNFHLPKSTLFMLVCAFCGVDKMHKAYNHAIKNDYRFYSYGDASLLIR